MPDIAIRAEGLYKRYKLGALDPYKTLRDKIAGLPHMAIRRSRSTARALAGPAQADRNLPDNHIWALNDVSFEVHQGEVLGIIGRNGAGKSTLLKVLSRITTPTKGRAVIHGRVGSLLEVGTGFHPELTGRENVFINGAILGMSRAEIRRNFDAIVDFSGVEEFLDTPVKRYSSGMRVRLAFAVAAFLDPEILFIDEVLSVGDVEFRARCVGRMRTVAAEGRTIVFVSHNMSILANLCDRGILLDQGRIVYDGTIDSAIREYMRRFETDRGSDLEHRTDRDGDGRIRLVQAWIESLDGGRIESVTASESFRFCVRYVCPTPTKAPATANLGVGVKDSLDRTVFSLSALVAGHSLRVNPEGGVWRCEIASLPVMPDRYTFRLHCGNLGIVYDDIGAAGTLEVTENDFFGSGFFPKNREKSGPLLVNQNWSS